MPQASEELRHAVGHYDPNIDADLACMAKLRGAGIVIDRGVIKVTEEQWKSLSYELQLAATYLCDEWDFCCED